MKMLFDVAPVIVAAGMAFEARIAKGAGVRAVYGQKREAYIRKLHDLARSGARGIISFGVAGGLSPSLKPGDVVVANSVLTAKARFLTDPRWSRSLQNAIQHAVYGLPVFAADATVMTVLEKESLWKGTGAAAVDMEIRRSGRSCGVSRPAFRSPESHHRSGSPLDTDQRRGRRDGNWHD